MVEKTGLHDYANRDILVGDKVSIYGLKGVVTQEFGAYGIRFDDNVSWNILYVMIEKETGCDNAPLFCDCDNFISFWEIAWNYNCESNYFPMVEKLSN